MFKFVSYFISILILLSLFRHKHQFYKVIRYFNWKEEVITNIFINSWQKNLKVKPIIRHSLSWKYKNYNSDRRFYLSQNKLQCLFHYSFSVPSRRLAISRFLLTKSSDRLILGGFQKT